MHLHGGKMHLEFVRIRDFFSFLFSFIIIIMVKVINIIIFQSVKVYFSVRSVVWSAISIGSYLCVLCKIWIAYADCRLFDVGVVF